MTAWTASREGQQPLTSRERHELSERLCRAGRRFRSAAAAAERAGDRARYVLRYAAAIEMQVLYAELAATEMQSFAEAMRSMS